MNAIMCFLLPNSDLDSMVGFRCSNRRLFAEYLYREDNPKDTLKTIIQIILYLNCYILIESNIPTWAEKLIEYGLGNFLLMVDPETKGIVPYKKWDKQNYFSLQKNNQNLELCFNSAKIHLAEPDMDGEIDKLTQLDSVTVMSQLCQIKADDTTEYDAAVAYMEGLHAIDQLLGYKKAQMDKTVRKADSNMSIVAGILK